RSPGRHGALPAGLTGTETSRRERAPADAERRDERTLPMISSALDAYDGSTIALATWAAGLRREAIPPAAAHALVWHHLDSVGCAVGAIGAPPCAAVRALAAEGAARAAHTGVSVVGLTDRVSAEIGAFANASMVRYLDYNDNYLRTGGGHTSDLIATL